MRVAWIAVLLGLACAAGFEWRDATARPKKPAEKVHVIQDFETEGFGKVVSANEMMGARVAVDGGHVFRCKAGADKRVCWLALGNVPKDVTPYRALRLRIRGKGAAEHPFYVRIMSRAQSLGLEGKVDTLPAKWKTVELLLPAMRPEDDFDPKAVQSIEILWFGPPAFTFEIDDIHMVEIEGTGGSTFSQAELIESAFGAKRTKKVKHIQTEHFDIYTDSAAARKKFPKALEAKYVFVQKTLRMRDLEKRLPVYIHQNSEMYFAFCARTLGWPLENARNSAGHGSGRYFATYYQSPKSDVVTHELAHSLFHRGVGPWGGSWFQEGVAVYVEYLYAKKRAAVEFAPILRAGRHTPLREFITIDRLIDAHDKRGGSSQVARLYLQAGALLEFLLESDVLRAKTEDGRVIEAKRDELPKAIRELAQVREQGADLAVKVEDAIEMSIEKLEKAWINWGSRPPKR